MTYPPRLPGWSLATLLSCMLAACGGDGAIPETPEVLPSIALSGEVERPSSPTVADLERRPAQTQTVSYSSGSGQQTRTYTGASLWSLLEDAGIKTDSSAKNDILRKYVVVKAADGYRVVFSTGELKPDIGNRASLVAYAETRDGKSGPLPDGDGPFRVTSPGDGKGGRYASMATSIEVRSSGSTRTGTGGGLSPSFTVSGAVRQEGSFDLAALQALPPVSRAVGTATYTGVDLWHLLNDVAGLKTAAGAKNPTLGMYAVATASDGYQTLLSMAEVDPAFGANQALVAYEVDGQPLDRNGMARLVLPGDVRTSRAGSNLVDLQVFALPTP